MVKAVIFDMDGVISDTQILHASADVAVLKLYSITFTEDKINENFAGITDKEMFENIFSLYGVPGNIKRAIKEKWKIMMARANTEITPVPGALKLINKLKRENLTLAVASSSPIIFINAVLSKLNIKGEFKVIVSGEEVLKGKPHPEIFLVAAKRLKAKPDECVVIEDSPSGMKATKSAGMKCIGLVGEKKPINPKNNYPADLIINDLRKLTLEQIKNL
ncbi:HAD family phosphatase [Candidatus Aerophobetes bacterium]|nr:HAD family phosphatase [Candidatus Aerophobetes bacterium]